MKTSLPSVVPGRDEVVSPDSIDPPHMPRDGFRAPPFGPPRNDSGEVAR
jgi:hypothetical protein